MEPKPLPPQLRPHRSISPKTMSWVPMMVTTSASMWPLDMKSSPCRCAKPGALILQRYGLFEPSLTAIAVPATALVRLESLRRVGERLARDVVCVVCVVCVYV